jgi:hypothetical protein
MIKRKLIIQLLILFSFSCNSNIEKKSSNIIYKDERIKTFITGFLKYIDSFIPQYKTQYGYITANLEQHHDTTVFSLANTYPMLENSKFIGSDSLLGYRILFIGELIKDFYGTGRQEEVPDDIKKLNERFSNTNKPPLFLDPIQWSFYFKNGRLIYFYPREGIKTYLSL